MNNHNMLNKQRELEYIENLYCFIKESLTALQPTGFGETKFKCPVCGEAAYIKRTRQGIYNKTDIECSCGYSFHS